MKKTIFDKIIDLLNEQSTLTCSENIKPFNYSQLKEKSLQEESLGELNSLNELLNKYGDDEIVFFKEKFIQLLKQRDNNNKDTCLSYFAIPEGDCNVLYWNIAKLIFNPSEIYELLRLLMPGLKKVLYIDFSVPQNVTMNQPPLSKRAVQLHIQEHDLRNVVDNTCYLEHYTFHYLGHLEKHPTAQGGKGCYLYHYGSPAKVHIIVVHSRDVYETACLSDAIYKKDANVIISKTVWSKDYTGTIVPNDDMRQLIKYSLLKTSMLTNFVAANDIIINLEQISSFTLELHMQLYKQLERYPTLREKIYQHNNELKQLLTDINFAKLNGRTPKEAILSLIHDLDISGKRHTGVEQASNVALLPLVDFSIYIDNLPHEQRNQLIQLSGSKKRNIINILETLEKPDLALETCVEIACYDLLSIVDKPSNSSVLDKMPIVTEKHIHMLKKKYLRHTICVTGYDKITTIPKKLSRLLLKDFMLVNMNDYTNLLIGIPYSEYGTFIKSATVLSVAPMLNGLAASFRTNMFDTKQKKSFFEAMFANMHKFGKKNTLLSAILADAADSIDTFLSAVPKNSRITAVNKRTDNSETILQRAIAENARKVVSTILRKLPKKDILCALNERNTNGCNALSLAVSQGNAEIFDDILSAYERSELFAAVTAKDNAKKTSLHHASLVGNIRTFNIILHIYEEYEQVHAIKEKDYYGNSVLHCATLGGSVEIFKVALTICNEDRTTMVRETNSDDYTILHLAAEKGNIPIFNIVLDLLNEDELIELLTRKVWNDSTLLHLAAESGKEEILKSTLNIYIKHGLLEKVMCGNERGNTPLHFSASTGNKEMFIHLLNSYEPHKRLEAVGKENKKGKTPLHIAASNGNTEIVVIILNLYKKEERLAAITKTKLRSLWGDITESPLQHAINATAWKTVRTMLSMLFEQDVVLAFSKKHGAPCTPLHMLAEKGSTEIFCEILDIYYKNDCLKQAKKNDRDNGTIFNYISAGGNVEIFTHTLELYEENNRLIDVMGKDDDGNTSLHAAAFTGNTNIANIILNMHKKEQRLAAITVQGYKQRTMLHIAAAKGNTEIIISVLMMLDEAERLTAITVEDEDDNTMVHRAASKGQVDVVVATLHTLQKRNWPTIITRKGHKGKSLLHITLSYEYSAFLTFLLSSIPEGDNRTNAIMAGDNENRSALHKAVSERQDLSVILNLLDKSKHLDAIMQKDSDGCSVLHLAASYGDINCFNTVLSKYYKEKQLKAIMEKDNYGRTTLHHAASNYHTDVLIAILDLFEKEKLLKVVNQKDNNGNIVLHHTPTYQRTDAFNVVLNIYEQNNKGDTIFAKAVEKKQLATILHVLERLPEEVKLDAVTKKCGYDNSVLFLAAKNGLAANILSMLPEQDRPAATMKKNKEDENILWMSLNNADHIEDILLTLHRKERLPLIKKSSKQGWPILQRLSFLEKPDIITRILNMLTEEEQLEIIIEKDEDEVTLLQDNWFISHYKDLCDKAVSSGKYVVDYKHLTRIDLRRSRSALSQLEEANKDSCEPGSRTNAISVIDAFIKSNTYTFTPFYAANDDVNEAKALLKVLTNRGKMVNLEMESLVLVTYRNVLKKNLKRDEPIHPREIPFVKALAQAYWCIMNGNTVSHNPSQDAASVATNTYRIS